ncbi:YodL domain-containing protein [Chakrabartyella piscis]|uniref:YodL domain-containing protein n=1 Tax=Chakrabartyella piscis TaxID=2918914 RepID=UPI0029585BC6|nr:YodL domain-containing protein [Chakrabartyella piscis]
MAENEVKQSPKERLKEITDSIETGIKDMFESEKYQSYLRTMSRFHKYSFNNKMLISMQNPNATLVAGYNKWKDQFSRNVKKGEKGIKIIAPTPFKVKEEREKLDPLTKAPLLDANGKIELEEVERQIPMFRVVSVFDVSQTEGKEIPSLVSSLDGSVEQYEIFIEALKRTSTVPIKFAALSDDTDGYYHLQDKTITIREGMSEVQTISAIVHEMAHSRLHDYELQKLEQQGEDAPPIEKKNRNTEEVEAESISFAVCSYYGIETGANSFGYIANWSKDKELSELKASLETIGTTSSALITSLDKHFAEITQEKEKEVVPAMSKAEELATRIDAYLSDIDHYEYQDTVSSKEEHLAELVGYLESGDTNAMKEYISDQISENHLDTDVIQLMNDIHSYEFMNYPRELAYKIDDKYFTIQDCNEGFDYSFFDSEFNLLDGGVYDDIEINIYQAIHELTEPEKGFALWGAENVTQVNYNELMENVDKVEMAKIESAKAEFTEPEHHVDETLGYPMPDPNLSREDAVSFGYTAEELLPLTKERAYELFQEDLTIYLLYPDNTEAMAFDIEELDSHAGYFGIEKTDWENFYEYKEMKELEFFLPEQREKDFLAANADSFAIYQLKGGEEYRHYHFTGATELEKLGLEIDRNNYNLVYTDELQNVSSIHEALDALYYDFNQERPDDFVGHSLSVSDIVAIKMNGVVSSHYVDSFGFKEVEHFTQQALVPDDFLTGDKIQTPRGSFSFTSMTMEQMQDSGYGVHHNSNDGKYAIMGNGTRAFAVSTENPLKNAELQTEQNFNMIDGIINNEDKAKKSVLAELKATTPTEHKKEKTAPKKDAEMER